MMDDLARVWRFRELLRVLVIRNTKLKYQRSVLGFLWTLLNPLLLISILLAVFTHIIRIQIADYWAFLLSGYFVFHCISQTVTASAFVYVEHATMLRSVALPAEAPILAAVMSRFLEYIIEFALIFLLIVIFRHSGVPFSCCLLPLLVVLQFLLVLGLALPLAALSVYYYDVRHMLPILLMGLFYLSPVFYSSQMVPEAIRTFYFLNPVAGIMFLYRVILYEGSFPPPLAMLLISLQICLILAVGYAIFRRHKANFAEVI